MLVRFHGVLKQLFSPFLRDDDVDELEIEVQMNEVPARSPHCR